MNIGFLQLHGALYYSVCKEILCAVLWKSPKNDYSRLWVISYEFKILNQSYVMTIFVFWIFKNSDIQKNLHNFIWFSSQTLSKRNKKSIHWQYQMNNQNSLSWCTVVSFNINIMQTTIIYKNFPVNTLKK